MTCQNKIVQFSNSRNLKLLNFLATQSEEESSHNGKIVTVWLGGHKLRVMEYIYLIWSDLSLDLHIGESFIHRTTLYKVIIYFF